MGKLFIFAIGGTGARVLRSLGMLLASGLKINAEKIIPIIIDTDSQNFDTNRAERLLRDYREIKRNLPHLKDSFFHNEICSLGDLVEERGRATLGDSFIIKLKDTTGKSFEEYINLPYINDFEMKSFINLLYSKQNLEDKLTHGFYGSPNVGCVVLDSINSTEEFNIFGNNFNVNDRIFIISSIFGGTGAAGFPLLINNFRNRNENLTNSQAIKKAIIGAVTVLPYFKLTNNDESRIESASFYTKSIAALSYYEKNITDLNALYYIGDTTKTNTYNNAAGGESQKNQANFIEMAAALSIYDFMEMPDSDLINNESFKEFAIAYDLEKMDFFSIGSKTKNILSKPLTLLKLFNICHKEFQNQIGASYMVENDLYEEFFSSDFYLKIVDFFNAHYKTWSNELENNVRGFAPFSNEVSDEDFSKIIKNKPLSKTRFGRSSLSKKHFFIECSKIRSKCNNNKEKFIDISYKASNEIFNKKIRQLIN